MNPVNALAESRPRKARTMSDRLFLLILVALQMAVQIGLFLAADTDASLLRYPVVDEWEYLHTARYLADWNFAGGEVFWHPPLYPWFLALVIKLTAGGDLLRLKLLNVPLFAATIPLLHSLLRHGWPERRRRVRILTALWAFYPLHLLFNLTLLGTTLYGLLTLLTLYFAFARPRPLSVWLAGLLSAYCRYYSLVLAPLMIWAAPAFSRRLKIALTLAFLAGSAWLPWHNHRLSGRWALDPQTFTNFYVGNSSDVRATMAIRPMEWRQLGAELAPYDGRILRRVREFTLRQAVRNTLIKTHYLLSGHEIPRNRDLGRIAAEAGFRPHVLVRFLLRWPFALLLALAAVGLLWRPDDSAGRGFRYCILANLAVMGLVMLFFFPTARYRLYWIPFLFLLAAAGLEAWPRRRRLGSAMFLAVLCLPNLPCGPYPEIPAVEENLHRAYQALQKGNPAVLEAQLPPLASYPGDFHYLRGGLAFLKGDAAAAAVEYRAALASDPGQWEAHWKLFLLADLAGDPQAAAAHLEQYQAVNLNHLAPGAGISRAIAHKRFDVLPRWALELNPNSEEGKFLRQALQRFR